MSGSLTFSKVDLEYKPSKGRRVARCRRSLQVRPRGQQDLVTSNGRVSACAAADRGSRPQPGRSGLDRHSAAAERAVDGGGRHLSPRPRSRARPRRRAPLLRSARPSAGSERAGRRADRRGALRSSPIGRTGTATWGSSFRTGSGWTKRPPRTGARSRSTRITPTRITTSEWS